MSALRSPSIVTPFSIDDESDGDSDVQSLATARSSPVPPPLPALPVPSTSGPYRDEDDTLLSLSPPPPDETSFYPPMPLRSNIPSREAAFEADDDTLDEDDLDPSEPLLMEGLLQSSAVRRGSLDVRV